MRLTLHTDFALRTLMYLGGCQRRATASEIAALFGISRDHLAKVIHRLARLGYVRCIRGIGGGVELARTPENIRIGEVIEAFEGNLHLLECVGTLGVCTIQSFCKLKDVLAEAEQLQLAYLNTKTLRDILPAPRELATVAKPSGSSASPS